MQCCCVVRHGFLSAQMRLTLAIAAGHDRALESQHGHFGPCQAELVMQNMPGMPMPTVISDSLHDRNKDEGMLECQL